MIKEQKYYVKGMHCTSCEVLIEKKLLELKGVKSVEASVARGEVLVEYEGTQPAENTLNQVFKEESYLFSDQPINNQEVYGNSFLPAVGIGLVLIIVFLILERLGLSGLVNVNSTSALPVFFVFGLLAGVSSCAALVGGMVLSMAKQWGDGIRPHFLFNLGRLFTFILLGGFLGLIGNRLQFSLQFTSFLVIGVSLLMIFSGLGMLGINLGRRLQLSLPKPITRYIGNENNFRGKWLPILLGALTFFLPCGFTLTAQGVALLSGSALQGSLIMLFFALGTLPMLLVIGFSSKRFFQNPRLSGQFNKIAGVLVLFFALYNLNAQFNRLGLPSLSDFGYVKTGVKNVNVEDLSAIVGGKQVIKMEASSRGYKPNSFKVRVGVPVRWEITDTGTSGCTNAVISPALFIGQIDLVPGQTSVKEFTPEKPGRYKFSCWMGMVSGVIEVVDKDGRTISAVSGVQEIGIGIGGGSCSCDGGNKGN